MSETAPPGLPVESPPASGVSALKLPSGFDPFTARYWVGRMDLRPIALFRFLFSLFLFYDLCDLLPSARTWFSDDGVLPRASFLSGWARADRFSLLDSFAWTPLVYVFFALAMVIILCAAVGYRSRLMNVLTFIMMASIQERIPPLFDGSDTVIRMLCLWHMFVPSGNVWSVDAVLAEKRGKPLPKEGCAFFIRLVQLQIMVIYFITALHKVQGGTWQRGDAIHYCLRLTHVFSRPWALAIADNAFLMAFGTYFTLVMEFGYVLLVNFPSVSAMRLLRRFGVLGVILVGVAADAVAYFVSWRANFPSQWLMPTMVGVGGAAALPFAVLFALMKTRNVGEVQAIAIHKVARALGMLTAVSLHIGIAFTINVGLFSYLMPTVQTAYFEPEWSQWVWDRIKALLTPPRVAAYRALAERFPMPRGFDPPLSSLFADRTLLLMQRWGSWALGAAFVVCTWYAVPKYILNNLRIPMPPSVNNTVEALDAWSSWDMFSPEPLSTDYHLTAPLEFEDGSKGNLFGGPTDGPGDVRGFWFSRWVKYFENVAGGNQLLPLEWGRYMCRERNFNLKPGEQRIYTFSLFQDNQRIPPIGQPWPPVQRATVWVHKCFDKPTPPANGQAQNAQIAGESPAH